MLKKIVISARNKIISVISPSVQEKRKRYLKKIRKKLKNSNPTIIASNCNGTIIMHDLGLRFNTPFINLWIAPKDYIRLVQNFDEYMNAELIEVKCSNYDYPIGLLKDIHVFFQHYQSFEEAKNKWEERKTRINKDNIFVLFTDRDGCTLDNLLEFEKLDYPFKIVFVHKPYKNISSAFYIKGFEDMDFVGICSEFMPKKAWLRYIDQFNYVKWLNSGIKKLRA